MRVKRRTMLAGLGATVAAAAGTGIWQTASSPPVSVWRKRIPESITRNDQTIFIDFGRVWFGNVNLIPNRANAGSRIKLSMGEKVDGNGKLDRNPFGTVRFYEVEAKLGLRQFSPRLTAADRRGITDGHAAMPFRYVEIHGWQGNFDAQNIYMRSKQAAQFERRGALYFTGSSPVAERMNRLMELGTHTMAATSFLGVFVDGDRERLPYEADGFINQLGWYAVAGDNVVPRRTIEALLKRATWPAEWMTHLIMMVWADYQATGDTAFIKRSFDKLKIYSLDSFVDTNGLINTYLEGPKPAFLKATKADYLQDIVDWPKGERDGYEMRTHITVTNSFACHGFEILSAMAQVIGREQDAQAYHKKAVALRQNILFHLFDGSKNLFRDAIGSGHYSAHASFVPLALNLVPEEGIAATVSHLKQRVAAYGGGFPCSVYGAQYLLEALFKVGEGKMAVDLILNETDRGWMHMLNAYDATVTHEAWDVRYKENIDWNHAWGSAFLNVAYRFILGAQMLAPGWNRWTLRPDRAMRESMKAHIPTPHGTIDVAVDAESRTLSVRTPKAAVFVPPQADAGWLVARVTTF